MHGGDKEEEREALDRRPSRSAGALQNRQTPPPTDQALENLPEDRDGLTPEPKRVMNIGYPDQYGIATLRFSRIRMLHPYSAGI